MNLAALRISNFQAFGTEAVSIDLDKMTYLVGPNGAGKTAILQALCRMFGSANQRRITRSDFHVPIDAKIEEADDPRAFWIEADFEVEELNDKERHATVPVSFPHMRLVSAKGVPRVRIRLDAKLEPDGEIEETLCFVLEVEDDGTPAQHAEVGRHDRSSIQIHYLPAKRDPGDHISYAATSLLGRILRAATWDKEREEIVRLTAEIGKELAGNKAAARVGKALSSFWTGLHGGGFYADPSIVFGQGELESLLRNLSVGFAPGHESAMVDFSRLSDGQKSLLYLSMVLAAQSLGRAALAGKFKYVDLEKLRPPSFTLIAMEEPENSLSPHYLGRIVRALSNLSAEPDGQALVATHAPSMLKRVPPEQVRYVRLDDKRQSTVRSIELPEVGEEDAHKYVREAVQAFPELYFSRLVLLGEGDTEEILLPRFMAAFGLAPDDQATSIAPLGGRHVHHFWRLLNALNIPHITLLDLDLGRNHGGWGRVRYAADQLLTYGSAGGRLTKEHIAKIPKWNAPEGFREHAHSDKWIKFLEAQGVFFSAPLDFDFAMLTAFPDAYEFKATDHDEEVVVAVLGKKHGDESQYEDDELRAFGAYHRLFKIGSKPAAHMTALAALEDEDLKASAPEFIVRLMKHVADRLKETPE